MKETLHYLIMANHLLFQKQLFAGIKDTELTLGQPKVLSYLKDNDGAVQKDIAAACHIEPASLTSVLSGMEKKGLIVRETRNGNRRSLYVFLTEKGAELAERISAEFDKIESTALNGFADEDREKLVKLLSAMYKNIRRND